VCVCLSISCVNYELEQLSFIPLVKALQTCNRDDRHPVRSHSQASDQLLSHNFKHTAGLHQVMLRSQTQTCPGQGMYKLVHF